MKKIDENGFWNYESNPISKVGVFPYLGSQIDESLEPDKVYYVYRPAEELFSEEAIASFNSVPVPLVDDHTMIGKDYTPAEQKGVDGVISNVRQSGDELIGDLAIYSESMKDKINHGKKDLSMGYFCSYDLTPGEWNGQHYDAIQRDIRSNHVALVKDGRCGHSVRVYDSFSIDYSITDNKEQEMKATDAQFEESKHKRDENGRFTSGGGSGSSSKGLTEKEAMQKIAETKQKRAESNKKGAETRSANHVKSTIQKVDNMFMDTMRYMPHAEQGETRPLHMSMQDKVKGAFGKVVSHSVGKYGNGEIIARKGNHDYKVTYNIQSDGKGKMEIGKWKITSAHDSLDISEQKEGVKMANLKAAKDGDLIVKHDDEEEKTMDASVDKRELIREIGAIAGQAGMSEELVRTLMQKAEELAYNGSEETKADDACDEDDTEEEIKIEEEEKAEDEDIIKEEEEKKEVDDEDEEEEEKKEDISKSLDAMPHKIMKMIAKRDALVDQLKPIIGSFNYQSKTADQVAKYACDALNLKVSSAAAAHNVLKGYLAGYKKSQKVYSMDSAASTQTNAQIEKYLKGE